MKASDAVDVIPIEVAGEGRRERRRRELRERVYAAARELFIEQGFDHTTIEQIVEAADIAPATFFNHFTSKNSLLHLMTGEVVSYLHLLVEQNFNADASTGDQLVGLAHSAAEQIRANRGVARDVMLELARTEARPQDATPYLTQLHAPLEGVLERGQTRGDVRTDADVAFLARMVLGMLNASVAHWLADPEYPIESELPRAARFAWEAVRNAGATSLPH